MSEEKIIPFPRKTHDNFYFGPDTALFDELVQLHVREAERRNAVIMNLGYVTTDDSILSKTNCGMLDTYISHGKVMHDWRGYGSKPRTPWQK
jgi:hypothetical protein